MRIKQTVGDWWVCRSPACPRALCVSAHAPRSEARSAPGWSPLSCRPTGAGCSVLLPSMAAHALRGWKRLSSLGFEVTSVISDALWEEGINVNVGSLSASNTTIFKGRFGDDYPSVWGNRQRQYLSRRRWTFSFISAKFVTHCFTQQI